MAVRYYPVALRLKGRKVLVAGGGAVAERKIRALLEAGARISVVSPRLTPGLKRLADAGRLRWTENVIRKRDLKGVYLAVAATSDNKANSRISRWAKEAGTLVNVVDAPDLSDFISPAVLRKGGAIIAVYSDGKDPVLSRDLKNFLKEHWDVFLSYRHRS